MLECWNNSGLKSEMRNCGVLNICFPRGDASLLDVTLTLSPSLELRGVSQCQLLIIFSVISFSYYNLHSITKRPQKLIIILT